MRLRKLRDFVNKEQPFHHERRKINNHQEVSLYMCICAPSVVFVFLVGRPSTCQWLSFVGTIACKQRLLLLLLLLT